MTGVGHLARSIFWHAVLVVEWLPSWRATYRPQPDRSAELVAAVIGTEAP